MQNSDLPPNPKEIARWEAEFNELMSKERHESEWDYATALQNAWEEGGGDSNDTFAHNLKFDQEGLPILDPYVFGSFPLY
jgi:peroxin-5